VGAAAVLAGGCNPAPRTLTQFSADAGVKAPKLWRVTGGARLRPGQRVVLAQEAVELVVRKAESPSERQAAFVPPHPVFIAAGAAGVGEKSLELDPVSRSRVADAVGAAWAAELTDAGLVVERAASAQGGVRAAGGRIGFEGRERASSQFNLGATDTGRIKSVLLVPARGTGLIESESGELAGDVAASVSGDGGAVVSLVVRVGVNRGYASVEQGSRVWVADRGLESRGVAAGSVVSEAAVLRTDAAPGVYAPMVEAYLAAVTDLARAQARAFVREVMAAGAGQGAGSGSGAGSPAAR
jgi:hypothetical protein